jgi:phospholipid/cholesterol/gamma-HCH transport system permease protein
MAKSYLNILGRRCISFITYFGGVGLLFINTLGTAFKRPFNSRPIWQQMNIMGVKSLPIVSLIAIFTGMVLAFQTAYYMQQIAAQIYVASLVALSMTRELGPVLTALIVAGRVGASITAEVGTMKVTEQIDALQALATNPIKYLVLPRLVALTFMLPILTVYADVIGMAGGFLIGVWKLGIGPTLYLRLSFEALVFKDVFSGLLKSFLFAIIISIVACYEGLMAEGGAEGVGRATTLSVVNSFIMIIACDCALTAVFYFIF